MKPTGKNGTARFLVVLIAPAQTEPIQLDRAERSTFADLMGATPTYGVTNGRQDGGAN
jgi:hypothetical protein